MIFMFNGSVPCVKMACWERTASFAWPKKKVLLIFSRQCFYRKKSTRKGFSQKNSSIFWVGACEPVANAFWQANLNFNSEMRSSYFNSNINHERRQIYCFAEPCVVKT